MLDKLPRSEQAEAVQRLRAVWYADTETTARRLAAALIKDFRQAGYDSAADCLGNDLDRCLAFFAFPQAHWSHLRTSNPIESVFAPVLRTDAARRFRKTKSGGVAGLPGG